MEEGRTGDEQSKEKEILKLKEEIQILQANVTQAAEAGMALLKSNQDLHEKYEKDMLLYQEQIEQLKQDNYTLSNKLSLQSSTYSAFLDELEQVKSHTEDKYEKQINTIQQNHQMKIQQFNLQLDELSRLIEKHKINEEKMNTKITLQEQFITKLKEEVNINSKHQDLTDEMCEIEKMAKSLKYENQELKDEIVELTKELSQITHQYESAQSRVQELEDALKERVELSNEWYRNLQESQESNVLLQSQIEKYKLEQLEDNWQNCGNSLFGEVEERRLETERKYISLQVKYETIERTHKMLKQHYKKLKAEMSALLCRFGTFTADATHLERLQRSLEQRNSEIQRLSDQVHKLERQNNNRSAMTIPTELTDKKGYILYLKQEIEGRDKSLCAVRHELELKSTQLVWETTKLSESESKLHKCEQERAKLVNDATKMSLKLSETTERENDLKVQIKALNKEISTLKDQLKTNFRTKEHVLSKEHVISKEPNEETCPNSSVEDEAVKENRKTSSVQSCVKKPINLLEELEKQTNSKKGAETVPTTLSLPLSLGATNENSNPNSSDTQVVEPTKDATSDKVKIKEDVPSSVKVIKVSENVNKCPQQ